MRQRPFLTVREVILKAGERRGAVGLILANLIAGESPRQQALRSKIPMLAITACSPRIVCFPNALQSSNRQQLYFGLRGRPTHAHV